MSRRLALALAALSILSVAGLAAAPAGAAPRTASAIGTANVNGKDLQVEVFVEVPRGQSARGATDQALAEQGARAKPPPGGPPGGGPPGGGGGGPATGGPTFTGLVWDVLPVVQSYNPLGEGVAAQSALTATQATWSRVPRSSFAMSFGGTTSRCPSLVRECVGPQLLDGFNDVGWARLGRNVLGVTWSVTGGQDEADMALNNRVPWNTGCTSVPGSVDVQTVLLHENGHVAGLGHASSTDSVMYPSYLGARCALGSLDQDAISELY